MSTPSAAVAVTAKIKAIARLGSMGSRPKAAEVRAPTPICKVPSNAEALQEEMR